MLVGLDDRAYLKNSLLGEVDIQNIKDCFAMNPATDKAIDINNLFAFDGDKNKTINALILWGHLLNFSEKNSEFSGKDIDFSFVGKHNIGGQKFNSPFYLTAKTGGVFTDKFQNKIYIVASDNPIARTLLSRNYYGNTSDYEIINYRTSDDADTSRYRGDGWGRNFLGLLTSNNNGGGKKILTELEKRGVNTRKANKPIMLIIDRDTGIDLIKIGKYASLIAGIIVNVFPGIGQALSTALLYSADYLSQYANNPNIKLKTSDYLNIGKALLPQTTAGDKGLWAELESGIGLYSQYENKDYLGMANSLGLAKNYANANMINSLNNDIKQNNVYKIRENQLTKADPTVIANRLQNYRNASLPSLFAEAATFAPAESRLLTDINNNGGISASPEMLKFFVAYAGGAYTSALPTANDNNGEDAITKLMAIDSSWKSSPEIHKAYLNMAVGLPTGTAAFDELMLAGIEAQIKNSGSKIITLPAQIPQEKAQCIAKELSTNGYTVYTSEYQLNGKNRTFPLADAYAENGIPAGINGNKTKRRVFK